VDVDWEALHGPAAPVRVPLPTYPFQRRRYWIPPGRPAVSTEDVESTTEEAEGEAGAGEAPLGADAPVGDDETWLAGVWSELLGIAGIGRHDDFTALGGHSLLAAQLVKRIRRARGVGLRIGDVFGRPTVAELAPLLAGDGAATEPDVDLVAEAILDPGIVTSGDSRPSGRAGSAATVLLTGATGFLGAYLCAELLASTRAEVLCLVRAADADEGLRRVRDRLAEFGLDPGPAADRLRAVPGDLARPLLGLDRDAFDGLATTVDAVYHCGAWVNFVRPYRALKPSNVLGTQEVLRLAATGGATVHHISTAAVHAGAIVAGVDVITEDADLSPPVGHETAYSQSKWVAEQLVWQAARRGLPVAVYRPGVVLGDTRTGVSNREDYYTRVIQGCVRLGAAPLRRFAQPAAAVDDVARTIVSISRAEAAVGHAFHPVAQRPLPWNEIFDHVRAMGYPVRSLPFEDWHRALVERREAADDPDLAPLADLIGGATADRTMPRFDTANVDTALGAGPRCSTLDGRYFATVLRYFRRVGWLPAPTGEGIPA
jgi:phthiocerol/phenolphthiocerol synthesis type-I polyketide synthase E